MRLATGKPAAARFAARSRPQGLLWIPAGRPMTIKQRGSNVPLETTVKKEIIAGHATSEGDTRPPGWPAGRQLNNGKKKRKRRPAAPAQQRAYRAQGPVLGSGSRVKGEWRQRRPAGPRTSIEDRPADGPA